MTAIKLQPAVYFSIKVMADPDAIIMLSIEPPTLLHQHKNYLHASLNCFIMLLTRSYFGKSELAV
jgi:hypothetical protein